MILKDILAISGSNGLFRFISKARNGIIVEGLADKKRINSPASARISALEDIAIYTHDKEVPLKEILQTIFTKENGGPSIDPKSDNNLLKKYFEEILPDYDRDRVYMSDIRKIFIWYGILQSLQMIDTIKEEETNEPSTDADANEKVDQVNEPIENSELHSEKPEE